MVMTTRSKTGRTRKTKSRATPSIWAAPAKAPRSKLGRSKKTKTKATPAEASRSATSKRRKKPTPIRKWDELPNGPLSNIAGHLPCYKDFQSMWNVCRHWRSARTGAAYRGTAPYLVPWLMLASEDDDQYQDEYRRFYRLPSNVKGANVVRMRLPKVTRGIRCVSSKGWMMAAPEDGPLTLFNPFSGKSVVVPDMEGRDKDPEGFLPFLHKFVLSSSPSENDDYWVVIVYGEHGRLAIWRPRYASWSKIRLPGYAQSIDDVAFYKGKLYAVTSWKWIY